MPAPVALAAGRAAGARRAPRNINGMAPAEAAAELDARRVAAKHEARNRRDDAATAADPDEQAAAAAEQAAEQPAPSAVPSPGGGRRPAARGRGGLPDTGGGLVLGAMLYVVGITYLRGGKPAVKQLLRAKFLNRVDG